MPNPTPANGIDDYLKRFGRIQRNLLKIKNDTIIISQTPGFNITMQGLI